MYYGTPSARHEDTKIAADSTTETERRLGANNMGIFKHGYARKGRVRPEYAVWFSMVARCTRQTDPSFNRYGALGIRVCDKWKDDFRAFIADMGDRPSPRHTIGRIDSSSGYCPENCRWETWVEQQNNRSITVWLTFQGETKPLSIMAREQGFKPSTIYSRIRRLGWSADHALTIPIGGVRNK